MSPEPVREPSRNRARPHPPKRVERAYRQTFRNAVMITAFVKSMKNAPTIGTTR